MDYRRVEDALAGAGLMARGGFHPEAADRVPGDPRALVLVGNAGPAMWEAFAQATTPDARRDESNPLDDWTRRVLDEVADGLGARPLFPFTGPPYPPFQRWALRAGGVHVSPIGPLIDPEFGLWHAYRGALAFAEGLDFPETSHRPGPCETCAEKPCLGACPVDAFAGDGEGAPPGMAPYDVPACVAHVASEAGAPCLEAGCLARRACPVGVDYVYGPEQARFHMGRFLKAQGVGGDS